jgi:hypothetical protein
VVLANRGERVMTVMSTDQSSSATLRKRSVGDDSSTDRPMLNCAGHLATVAQGDAQGRRYFCGKAIGDACKCGSCSKCEPASKCRCRGCGPLDAVGDGAKNSGKSEPCVFIEGHEHPLVRTM